MSPCPRYWSSRDCSLVLHWMADFSDSPRQCESLGKSVPTVLQMVSQVPEYVKMASIVSNSSDRSEVTRYCRGRAGCTWFSVRPVGSQNDDYRVMSSYFFFGGCITTWLVWDFPPNRTPPLIFYTFVILHFLFCNLALTVCFILIWALECPAESK